MNIRYLPLLAIVVCGGAHAQEIAKREPPAGSLRGMILVDDGSCPKGQIKEVSQGGSAGVGGNTRGTPVARSRRCVARR